jgi:hypothetical protein
MAMTAAPIISIERERTEKRFTAVPPKASYEAAQLGGSRDGLTTG